MLLCRTDDVEQTRALAAAVASLVGVGDLLVLVGDLGAGKTHFTQGFARACGVTEPVTSPTFTLANRYVGDVVVNHLDAYRLDDAGDADDLAIPELIEDGVTLIEWGNNIAAALPADRLEIRIDLGEGDDERKVTFVPLGALWRGRSSLLATAVQPWRET